MASEGRGSDVSGDARIRRWLLVSTGAADEEASSRLNGSRPQVQPFSCLMKTGNKGKRRSERASWIKWRAWEEGLESSRQIRGTRR
jgi:hypothetical protein